MLSLLGLFTIVLISYFVIRVASVALEITGLAEDVANFQALSAFTGTGFTSSETESVVGNPTRRGIIRTLIILGNAGLTTAMASLVLTFMGNEANTSLKHLAILFGGLIVLFLIIRSKQTYYAIKKISYKLLSNYTSLQVHDYHEVLGLGIGYVISKVVIDDNSWMLNKELKDLKLDREGTLILSIEKHEDGKKKFIGAPSGKTSLEENDVVTCYGRPEAIKDLAAREIGWMGDKCHEDQIDKLKEVECDDEELEKLKLVNE